MPLFYTFALLLDRCKAIAQNGMAPWSFDKGYTFWFIIWYSLLCSSLHLLGWAFWIRISEHFTSNYYFSIFVCYLHLYLLNDIYCTFMCCVKENAQSSYHYSLLLDLLTDEDSGYYQVSTSPTKDLY